MTWRKTFIKWEVFFVVVVFSVWCFSLILVSHQNSWLVTILPGQELPSCRCGRVQRSMRIVGGQETEVIRYIALDITYSPCTLSEYLSITYSPVPRCPSTPGWRPSPPSTAGSAGARWWATSGCSPPRTAHTASPWPSWRWRPAHNTRAVNEPSRSFLKNRRRPLLGTFPC